MATQSGQAKAVAVAVAVKSPKSRGEGPVAFSYIDAEDEEHKRIPATVKMVLVKDRITGKAKAYDPARFHPNSLVSSAVLGFVKRAQNRIVADKNGKDIHFLTDGVFADFLEGRLYSKSDSKGRRGRTFDPKPLVDAVARLSHEQAKNKIINQATKRVVEAMTDADKARMIAKINSKQGKERSAYIKQYTDNKLVNKYYLEAKAKAKVTSKEDLAQTVSFDF